MTPAGMSLVASASAKTTAVRGSNSEASSDHGVAGDDRRQKHGDQAQQRRTIRCADNHDAHRFRGREIEVRTADRIAGREQRGVLVAPSRVPHGAIDRSGDFAFGLWSPNTPRLRECVRSTRRAALPSFRLNDRG